MEKNKLKIAAMMQGGLQELAPVQRLSGREKKEHVLRAHYERLWLRLPEQFDPSFCVLQTLRIERSFSLLTPLLKQPCLRAVDLGLGSGALTRLMLQEGVKVDAIDIANNALRRFKEKSINTARLIRATLPFTPLQDNNYDLVICTDVIAELDKKERRLLVSEMSRLVKKDGYILCSTALDTESDDALSLFLQLMQTECTIVKCLISYHSLWLRLQNCFQRAFYFVRASKDHGFLHTELQKKSGLRKKWLKLQTTKPFALWWRVCNWAVGPLLRYQMKNKRLLLALESFCRRWRPGKSASHVICLLKKRPLESHTIQSSPIETARQTRLDKCIWT